MFIKKAIIDDTAGYTEAEYEGSKLNGELVPDLVGMLDGERHTLLTLSPEQGDAHMAVGGDSRSGLVVYMTEDNESFLNLRARDREAGVEISVVAGGQPGEYDSSIVVTLEEALAAATCYAESGKPSDELQWEEA